MPGFHVEHFGCRAARADGEAVSDRLRAAGFCERQPFAADLVVVNTCSVTAEADRAARAFIRRAHRLNPAARIVVTGCYAQRAPEELAGLAGVAAVVGNSHKALAPDIMLHLVQQGRTSIDQHQLQSSEASQTVEKLAPAAIREGFVSGHDFSRAVSGVESTRALAPEARPSGISPNFRPFSPAYKAAADPAHSMYGPNPVPFTRATYSQEPTGIVSVQSLLAGCAQVSIWADDRFAHSFLEEAQVMPGTQTRPNLKIQEGCGNRCAFCVIPQTRGASRSLPGAAVLKQVEGFVAAGGNELVFSGINLGRWGKDLPATEGLPRPALAGLVRQVFEQTGLPRLRLSSIEPMDWDAELIGLMGEFGGTRLARHAHLPLQSGSDAVLRRTHRRYRPWHYAEKVEALMRAAGPELTLGADVMVGFPGETDGEFEETLEMVRALPFGYLHLFPFSPRPGTRGWALHADSPVPAVVVEERMAALRALASRGSSEHRKQFVGRELDAITLHTPAELAGRGWTAALTENFLPVEIEGRLAANRLVRVRVSGLNADGKLEAAAISLESSQYAAMAMSV
jgi:threonylcarbamoyladenosine tRNA methylthiotransferase MtaB